MFGRSQLPDIFSVLNINSRLFWGWLYFASRLMPFGRLPAATREKIILRTAWNTRSRYEWGPACRNRPALGRHRRRDRRDHAGPPPHSAIRSSARRCRPATSCCATRSLPTQPGTRSAAITTDKLLLEIVMLIGHYEMVAGFLNTARPGSGIVD